MTKPPHAQRRSRQELARALEAAIGERDRALSQLADARAELNRRRLASAEDAQPGDAASRAAAREVLPLRYRLADAANNGLRRVLGPWHRLAKEALSRSR